MMFSADFRISQAISDLRNADKNANRAAMYAVREVGRTVKREATKRAPVYRPAGSPRVTAKSTRARLAAARSAGDTLMKGPAVPGLLKLSIKSSRAMKGAGGSFSLKVGPRGARTHLYAQKAEAQHHYMAAGNAAAEARAAEVWNKAFTRTLARYK